MGREEPSSPMAASCSEPVRAGAGAAHEGSRGGPLAGPDVGASPAWDGAWMRPPKRHERSHFPAVWRQDKMGNSNHSMVLEAKEQVVNGFRDRWYFLIVVFDRQALYERPERSLIFYLFHLNACKVRAKF